MKKITKVASILALFSVALLNGTNVAQADTAGSKGTVEFTQPDIPLKFVDGGASDIAFGQVVISGDSATYNAIYTDTKFTEIGQTEQFSPLQVSVKDDRGTMPGYKVKVAMTKQFTNDTAAVKTLAGATVELTPTSAATNKEIGSRVAPSAFIPNVVVGEGIAAQNVFGAKAANNATSPQVPGEGAGTWTVFFGDRKDGPTQPGAAVKNDKIKLHLPGGAVKQESKVYEADLTWTLEDTPI